MPRARRGDGDGDGDGDGETTTPSTTTKIPTRLNGAQARTLQYCWATTVNGEICGSRREPGSSLPYCARHRARGDDAFEIVPHPTLDGKVLVATRDLPKGYKTVYWGERKSWRECGRAGRDHAMCFRRGGGVIDPTPCGDASQLQFMSNPGPNEVTNNRSTNVCFGDTRSPKGTLVGREFMLCRAVKKNEQLTQWYGASWFHSRGIARVDTGTDAYPAPRRRRAASSARDDDDDDKDDDDDGGKDTHRRRRRRRVVAFHDSTNRRR